MTEKLTKRLIDSLTYNSSGGQKYILWDTEISGFGIRVYPSGKKSFVLFYRQGGTQRLFTIGQYGNITLEVARELAKKKMGEVADGKDPLLNRRAEKKKHEWTVKRAFSDFLKKYAKIYTKTWAETERIFNKDILPAIGSKPIDEVKKDDILKILNQIVDRKSGLMANKTLDAVSSFFNWCVQRGIIEHSPTYQIKAPTRKRSRDRVLADYELKEIWQACEGFGYPFGPLVQFLILTGQRRGEVASMTWDDYDEENTLWTLPRENTKTDRQHHVHVSELAAKILEGVPNMGSYVFTSAGERPFENFSRDKKELDAKIGKARKNNDPHPIPPIPAWTLHDIRRTVASGMARLGIAPHIVEKILNHSSGVISGVAAVYNRYEYAEETKAALDQWAEHIQGILENEQASQSVLRVPKKSKSTSH
jgi:integrase